MTRLPSGAQEYLAHLSRLKEALEHGELTPAQKNLAEPLFNQAALTRQRRQYIADMVAAGYTDQEIKLAFASPDSPMTILIIAFTETDTAKDLQQEISNARKEHAAGGEDARVRAHIRQQHQLLETVWAAVAEAGAVHKKSLIDTAKAILQDIAEAEGLQYTRAGRRHTKRPQAEPPPDADEPPTDPEKPDWGKGFVPDEADD